MARVTLVLTDITDTTLDGGEVDVQVDFDPPLNNEAGISPAQALGCVLWSYSDELTELEGTDGTDGTYQKGKS